MGELYAAAQQPVREAAAHAVEEVAVEERVVTTIVPEPAPVPARDAGARAAAEAADEEDIEGARLIALNMALNGQSRAETDRYLAENFDLSNRSALLDEVYATVDG
jgi:hypothetical protein